MKFLNFSYKCLFSAILTAFLVLSLIMPSPFYLTGCAKKEKLLENKSLRTEYGGKVKFHSEALQQDITVKAKDNRGYPLRGMDVQYSVTQRYVVIMVRDPKGNHIPGIFVGTPDDFKEKQASMSLVRSAYAIDPIVTPVVVGGIIVFTLPIVVQTAGYIAPIVSSSILGGLEAIRAAMSTAMQPTSIQIKGPLQNIFSQLESKNINSGALKIDLPDMEDPIWLQFAIPELSAVAKQNLAEELVEKITEEGVSLSTGEEYEIEVNIVPIFNIPIVVKCEPIKTKKITADEVWKDSLKITAGEVWKDSLLGMEFVWVPGGCFEMGDIWGDGEEDERPVHKVCLDGFWMGRYEVTQGQWQRLMGDNPAFFGDCGDNCPVERVSWNEAVEFGRRLSQKTGHIFRLPTEAEWEYACRSGGKKEKYSGGDNVDAVAWYDDNSKHPTHPVGQKRPNGLGIYDMSGNVCERCGDWYFEGYYGTSPKDNPQGPSKGKYRIIRGGSWAHGNECVVRCTSRSRSWNLLGDRVNNIGFRLVRVGK